MASDRASEASAPASEPQLDSAAPQLDPAAVARCKEAAARAAAQLVRDGMAVGLGTGSTVAHLLSALGERARELSGARFVATSPATAGAARELGLRVCELDELVDERGALDIAIDGADQVDPDGWLIKGGGGAHTREKIVISAARRFVAIVSPEKLVARLQPPVPLEVLEFGARHTLAALGAARLRAPREHGLGSDVRTAAGDEAGDRAAVTAGRAVVKSPDGNLLAFYDGPVDDPRALAARLSQTPGVVEHGLFAPELVSEVLIGSAQGMQRRPGGKPAG